MTHYDDVELLRYGMSPELHPEMAAHIAECGVCRAELEELTAVDEVLRDPETWAAADALARRSARMGEFLEELARSEAENEAADRLLAPLLRSPLRFRLANVVRNPKARTAGVVRRLCAAAHRLHEQRPQFSFELATAACGIARTLERGRFSIAVSLRERANALRYLGRFNEALQDLDAAEQHLGAYGEAHDLAIVWFIRATVFMKMGRLEEARQLAPDAAQVFRDHGDTARELGVLLLDATCLSLSGRSAEAAPTYERIAVKARAIGNRSILGRAAIGAANSYLDLARYDDAERYYIEALVLFEELGLTTEKVRAEWSLALMSSRRGDPESSAKQLDPVRRTLLNLGLLNDHALATLDWAAARLASGAPEGVAATCSEIMVRFESEGMMRSARLALAYVHEALARGRATPALIQHVRTYLELLPENPESRFVPLQ